ncbi:MAG: histidine ammonia-lyase [Phycisphaerales bacterium]
MPGQDTLPLDGTPLSVDQVHGVAHGRRRVELDPQARRDVEMARAAVDRVAAESRPVYGVNTGFGSLAHVRVEPGMLRALQRNIVRSHAAGVGDPLSVPLVRAMLLLLAASLSRGRSGVRVVVVERLIDLLNHGITPVVPERGSVGASGDLAPLAHASMALLGEGDVLVQGRRQPAAEALRSAGLAPIDLEAKEGLALLNGTHLMAARGALAFAALDPVLDAAIGAAAMSIDACMASEAPLDGRIHEVRFQPGQIQVARRMKQMLAGSQIISSHREGDPRVQDPYSLRCTPQVLGAVMDQLRAQRSVIEHELGAVTDNPLVVPASGGGFDVVSGGNFHGMPLAIAMDAAKIAICHVAGISERRTFWVLSGLDTFNPVKPHLAAQPGLESGLMITQYTAAACVNELQSLAHPASVGNVSTCGGIEDYNSFGPLAGAQLDRAVRLLRDVIAVELLVMSQALEAHRPRRSGEGVERLHAAVRRLVPPLGGDRSPAPDIAAIAAAIEAGTLAP